MAAVFDYKLCLCYGAMALFNAMLHNVFLLYHVETFVSVYKIDKLSFWAGEAIFLIWNSCNDPLFGWISDKTHLTEKTTGFEIVQKRLRALCWNGPFFALSFLSFWVSWTYPSLQFVICLCLYDGFLTVIDLHHNSLLADLALSAETRTRLNSYCSVFNAFGSLTVFVSYYVWDREHLYAFRILCLFLTIMSVCGFVIAAKFMMKLYKPKVKEEDALNNSYLVSVRDSAPVDKPLVDNTTHTQKAAVKKFMSDLCGHRNFVYFGLMNLVQVFHCHFNSNFFPLFLENLLGGSISQTMCSVILGVSFIAPHLNNLYFLSLCRRYGVYRVIRGLFYLKLGLSLLMLYLGPKHIWVLCVFIASNRVFTEGTCKLLNLVISDLVDEDCVLHSRSQAVSALMFGTASFVSKPGQTLAPLIGTWLLSVQTGHDLFASGNELGGSIKLDLSHLDSSTQDMYKLGVFHLLVYIPIVCAILQLLAWTNFTLHGQRLSWVKEMRQDMRYGVVV